MIIIFSVFLFKQGYKDNINFGNIQK